MNLASAFEGSASLVTLTRLRDDRYVDVNPGFERQLGFRRAEVLGQTPVELGIWDAADRTRLLTSLETEQGTAALPIRCRRRDGSEYHGLLNASYLTLDGERYLLSIVQGLPAQEAGDAARWRAEARYRSIFDHAVEAIYQSTPEGRFIDANPAMAALLGYATSQELMREVRDIGGDIYADPEARAALVDLLDRHGRFEGRELQVKRRDGSLLWVSENAHAVQDEVGGLMYFEGTFVDISARKAAEAALLISEQKYRTLLDNSQDGVFLTQDDKYVYVNQAFADMLGCAGPAEIIGTPFMRFVAPEDQPFLAGLWEKRHGGAWVKDEYELHLLKKDGGTRILVSVRAGAISLNGRLASTGTIRDVTEERRVQQALRDAEQRFRAIFENAVIGMYQTSPDGQFLNANQTLADVFGYASPAALCTSVATVSALYRDPEERRGIHLDLERHGQVSGREVEMLRRDGQSLWASLSARVVRDAEGKVTYYEGSLQDITARKRMETALQRSEQRYRMLVDHAQVGVFIIENGYYTYVNHAFAAMLGYGEAQLTGMHYRDLVPPEDAVAADARYQRRSRGEAAAEDAEVTLLHRDKKTRLIVTQSVGAIEQDGRRFLLGTARDITAQRRFEAQLSHNATHDPLTGLPNRTLFIERLAKTMEQSRPEGAPGYAVLFIDLDSFNVVNDSLGHAAGDELLVQVAQRLKQCLGPDDTLARHGGDEFTVLVAHTQEQDDAVEVAERILAELVRPVRLGDNEIYTNASIGIAPGHADYASTEELLRDADTAMYRAKAAGKAGYVVFDQDMYARARARLRVETELRQALENRELRVHYQPIVAIGDGTLLGFEALVRWQHPVRGLLSPDAFLPVAEETGLILPIGWWLLHEACRQLKVWRASHPQAHHLTVAVNLAHKQFMYAGLPQQVISALQESGLEADGLHLEITENVFLENPKAAEHTLRRLRALGIALHLDDFGTGFSSLNYLSALPLDTLKIDRSFVGDVVENTKHAAVVRTILELARDLGMNTIAEGVENVAQLELLDSLGCRSAQGFLFAPALDVKRADRLFERTVLSLRPGDEGTKAGLRLPHGELLKRTRDFFRRV